MAYRQVPIISVTGTKGKTTVVNLLADILRRMHRNVLQVDTTGHFVNDERKSTLEDSKEIWNLVPSVCPGRYLYEFHAHPELKENGVAVLETALGCSGSAGLGYRCHEVGIFLNVFEDHLGSSERLQTREDIAKAKSFIFERVNPLGGYAVFNADDPLVCKMLTRAPADITLVPCGLEFSHFDLEKHLAAGGSAVTIEDECIVLKSAAKTTRVCELANLPWTFRGKFMPSVWNSLHVVGALYGYFGGTLPAEAIKALEAARLDPSAGRLVLLQAASGTTILADYAHEKVSLAAVGQLAHELLHDDGQVIGVVRLAHDRTDQLIHETGHIIGSAFDQVVVYEKIDGYWRQPKVTTSKLFPQVVGRTSEKLLAGVLETNPSAVRIVREDEAIAHAAEIARSQDTVVVIVNDDIGRSLQFIKDSFMAELV